MGGADFGTSSSSSPTTQQFPVWRLCLLSVAWIGVQVIWSSEYAATTPFFEAVLGFNSQQAQAVWVAGPVTGLLVQPVVGALSDRCTSRFGRRRPFIVGGAFFVIVGSLLFSNCVRIAGNSGTGAAVIAIAAFWLMDLSINTLQGPLRALMSDMATPEQQSTVQTFASLCQGAGQIAGFFLYSSFSDPSKSIDFIFLAAYSTLAITMTIGLAFSSEKRYIPEASAEKDSCLGAVGRPFKNILLGLRAMPNAMLRVAIVQAFTWFAWFCLNTIMTSWFGHNIMHGDPQAKFGPEADKYATGIKMGGRAGVYQAAVQLVASFLLPPIIYKCGIRWTYVFCLCTACGCFFAAFFAYSPLDPPPQSVIDGAYASIALTGIGLAATNIFPFTLVGLIFADQESSNNKGLNMGVLNVFIVIPQLIDTQYTGIITEKLGGERYVILVGGCWWVFAIVAAMFLKIPKPVKSQSKEPLLASADESLSLNSSPHV